MVANYIPILNKKLKYSDLSHLLYESGIYLHIQKLWKNREYCI